MSNVGSFPYNTLNWPNIIWCIKSVYYLYTTTKWFLQIFEGVEEWWIIDIFLLKKPKGVSWFPEITVKYDTLWKRHTAIGAVTFVLLSREWSRYKMVVKVAGKLKKYR